MQGYPELALVIDGERISAPTGPQGGQSGDRATLAELPLAGAADLDRALEAARRGFELWRRRRPSSGRRCCRARPG